MSDSEEPEDRRTEGVRIIGAQEAAEAAGRPDVVQRRRGRQKRYGDRPDEPEQSSDLPKITISTTETESAAPADHLGDAVRPEDEPAGTPGEPRWGDEPAEEDPRAGFGHARIVEPGPSVSWADETGPSWQEDEPVPSASGAHSLDDEDETRPWTQDELAEAAELDEEPPPPGHRVDQAYAALLESGFADDPDGETSDEGATSGEDDRWQADEQADEPEDDLLEDDLLADDRLEPHQVAPEAPAAREDEMDLDDEDSFVLPHWTEPPTGQVPKVVVGDEAPEPDALATYGSQPRWRDEGEWGAEADFDDLIDEGPRLGALAGDDSAEDDFFTRDFFDVDDEVGDDELDEYAYEDDYDDDVLAGGPRRGRGRGSRRDDTTDGAPPNGGDRDLVTAVAVGVGLLAVGLLCFALGPLPTTILATVVVAVAAWEYFAAVRTSGHNPATLLGMASVIGVMVAAFTSGLAAYPVVLGLSVVAGLLWYLWVAPGEHAVQNLGLTLLGVLWIGVLGSFATLFLGLGELLTDADASLDSNPGIGVLIAAVIAAAAQDIGAYFSGRYFGRTPLSAASPNKTQEGLAGGVLTSLVATVVIVGVVGIDPIGSDLAKTFVFALVCALVAPLGDLAESFVKRDLDIKDMGAVLPGHGGVLDRFDGLLFVLPAAYFVTLLFDIWSGAGV